MTDWDGATAVRQVDWKYFALALLFILAPLLKGEAQDDFHFILSLAWSPDGAQFAIGESDGTVSIWDAATLQPILTFPFAPDEPWSEYTDSITPFQVRGLAWSPDGTKLAAGATAALNAGLYRVFDPETGEVLTSFDAANESSVVAWSPDGTQLAATVIQGSGPAAGNWIEVRDVATGQLTAHLDIVAYDVSLLGLAWSPDGTKLVGAGFVPSAIIWDTTTWTPLVRLESPEDIMTVAWSPDSVRLAAGCWDGSIRIWNIVTEQLLWTLPSGYDNRVYQISWQPEGTLLASAAGQALQVWDTDTGTLFETVALSDLYPAYTLVAWNPDGNYLLNDNGNIGQPEITPVSLLAFPLDSSF